MRKLAIFSMVGLFTSAMAMADVFSTSRLQSDVGTPSHPGAPRVDEYRLTSEDGSSENSVGLTAGGNLAWLNRFTVSGALRTITHVNVVFGTPLFPGGSGVPLGTPFTVYVWNDLNNDGTPDNNALIASANAVTNVAPDQDVFQQVPIAGAVIPAANTSFFVGLSVNHPAGTFPASLDQTAPTVNQSWVAGSTTPGGFNPNNITGGIGLFRMDQIGLPGDWLVRANAVPEPATLGLLALGVLGLLRRR